ncbi:MAG: hypothetical protein J0L82_12585 [Deltaproteobacteria bacterium]|nr:hypothetical protein [Deltaproteobacteria bacterium]
MMQSAVTEFIQALRKQVDVPKNIQLASLACGSLASIFDEQSSKIISETVYSGIDRDPERSVLKGLVEFVERRAFAEGRSLGLPICQTPRSDGFAAYPKKFHQSSATFARQNALAEAVERFVWSNWWDDTSFIHEFREVDLLALAAGEDALLDVVRALRISSVAEIRPQLQDSHHQVILYFASIENGGVISGGACGVETETESTRYRALGELLRHALALRKMNIERIEPVSFYERRLAYFGNTKMGSDAARTRVAAQGTRKVRLPHLLFDAQVPHTLAELVTVHRCYFVGQPEFVGGKLERLCL